MQWIKEWQKERIKMRYTNEESIKEVINQLIETYKLREKLNQVQLLRSWETIMGPLISKRTNGLFLKNDVLHISLKSAPLKEELYYGKDKIKNLLNAELGGEYIKDVVVT